MLTGITRLLAHPDGTILSTLSKAIVYFPAGLSSTLSRVGPDGCEFCWLRSRNVFGKQYVPLSSGGAIRRLKCCRRIGLAEGSAHNHPERTLHFPATPEVTAEDKHQLRAKMQFPSVHLQDGSDVADQGTSGEVRVVTRITFLPKNIALLKHINQEVSRAPLASNVGVAVLLGEGSHDRVMPVGSAVHGLQCNDFGFVQPMPVTTSKYWRH